MIDFLHAVADDAASGLTLPEMLSVSGIVLVTANQRLVASLVLDITGPYVPYAWPSDYAREVFRQECGESARVAFCDQ